MIDDAKESELLTAFARAAIKAQEIEVLLQEVVLILEVASDTRNRSFEAIAKKIEKLPLGPLKDKYLETIGARVNDPLFLKMWNEINRERVFLMHKFFTALPKWNAEDNAEAKKRIGYIDGLLDIGRRLLRDTRDMTMQQFNITPAELRELIKLVADQRRNSETLE